MYERGRYLSNLDALRQLERTGFSSRVDSSCVPTILDYFKELYPDEIDNFKKNVSENPFVDLACGDYYSCYYAIKSLVGIMGVSSNISYIGVDRFNIDENSVPNLKEKLQNGGREIFYRTEDTNSLTPRNELQPDLSQNIKLISSDMFSFLAGLPSQSIKILCIGAFDGCICRLSDPYRKQVVAEIQRTLVPDSYFLCAGSFLDVSCEYITEINKNNNLNYPPDSPVSKLWPHFQLYKNHRPLTSNSNLGFLPNLFKPPDFTSKVFDDSPF